MGKKGSWFSAIKKVFTNGSSKEKQKLSQGSSDKKYSKEKKKGKGILKHGETKSFIPMFRDQPSSIEKILGEADQLLASPSLYRRSSSPNDHGSGRASSAMANSPRISSARLTSPKEVRYVPRPDPTLRNRHLSATMIQAAYRGYLARRNFRALRGLVRLQGVMRGQNIKRQTMNAMKQMQLLVRVQTQIQSRRIQMLERHAVFQNQTYRNDKEFDSTLNKWALNQLSEDGNNEGWDDSVLTKEEIEARLRKKVDAIIKRERAMAYAYSHRLWKGHLKSEQSPPDFRSHSFPWWWNWLERQLPPVPTVPTSTKRIELTPPQQPSSEYKPSPRLNDVATPLSTRSAIHVRAKHFQTPSPGNASGLNKYSKPRTNGADQTPDLPLRDDDSLTSCPPFSSTPNYMTPTASAKAKLRSNNDPKDRVLGSTPSNDSKRRFSFTLTTNIGSFKWNKGSKKDSEPHKVLEKHSIGDLSIDSIVSMPARVGKRPFNRFV